MCHIREMEFASFFLMPGLWFKLVLRLQVGFTAMGQGTLPHFFLCSLAFFFVCLPTVL